MWVRKHGIDRHTKQYLLEFRCQLISFLVRRIECFSVRDLARVMQFWFTSNHGYLWKMKKKNHIFGYFKFVQDEKYFGIELWGYVYL